MRVGGGRTGWGMRGPEGGTNDAPNDSSGASTPAADTSFFISLATSCFRANASRRRPVSAALNRSGSRAGSIVGAVAGAALAVAVGVAVGSASPAPSSSSVGRPAVLMPFERASACNDMCGSQSSRRCCERVATAVRSA